MPIQLSVEEKAGLDRLETQIEAGFTAGAEQPPGSNVVPALSNYDKPMRVPVNGVTTDMTSVFKPQIKGPFKMLVAALQKAMWGAWIPVSSFGTNWRQWPDGSFGQCAYRKDVWGLVRVRGLFSAPAAPSGTTIFTLPPGYRPSAALIFAVTATDAGAGIEVRADGTVVQRYGPAGNVPTGDTAWYSVNISFEAEQ